MDADSERCAGIRADIDGWPGYIFMAHHPAGREDRWIVSERFSGYKVTSHDYAEPDMAIAAAKSWLDSRQRFHTIFIINNAIRAACYKDTEVPA